MKDRPEIDPTLIFFYEAFHDLSTSRPVSQAGPLPIPISEVLAYCEFYQIHDLDFRSTLLGLVKRMDGQYLESFHKKTAKKT